MYSGFARSSRDTFLTKHRPISQDIIYIYLLVFVSGCLPNPGQLQCTIRHLSAITWRIGEISMMKHMQSAVSIANVLFRCSHLPYPLSLLMWLLVIDAEMWNELSGISMLLIIFIKCGYQFASLNIIFSISFFPATCQENLSVSKIFQGKPFCTDCYNEKKMNKWTAMYC